MNKFKNIIFTLFLLFMFLPKVKAEVCEYRAEVAEKDGYDRTFIYLYADSENGKVQAKYISNTNEFTNSDQLWENGSNFKWDKLKEEKKELEYNKNKTATVYQLYASGSTSYSGIPWIFAQSSKPGFGIERMEVRNANYQANYKGKNFKDAYNDNGKKCPKVMTGNELGNSDTEVSFFSDSDQDKDCNKKYGKTKLICSNALSSTEKKEETKKDDKYVTSCPKSLVFKDVDGLKLDTEFAVTNKNNFVFRAKDGYSNESWSTVNLSSNDLKKGISVLIKNNKTGNTYATLKVGPEVLKAKFKQTDAQKKKNQISCTDKLTVCQMSYDVTSSNGESNVLQLFLTDEEGKQAGAKACAGMKNESVDDQYKKENMHIYRIRRGTGIKVKLSITNGCDVLSKDMKSWLQWLLDVLRIGGIVLSVVLSIADYIKAIASSDKDSLNKASKNVSTRVICVGVLLLVPVIVEFILQLVNIGVTGDNPRCGIQ